MAVSAPWVSVNALNSVDLPTLGSPTIAVCSFMESVVLEKHLWVIRDDCNDDDRVKADDFEKAAVSRDVVRTRDIVRAVTRTFIVETDLSTRGR